MKNKRQDEDMGRKERESMGEKGKRRGLEVRPVG